jgi:hypothetical protein
MINVDGGENMQDSFSNEIQKKLDNVEKILRYDQSYKNVMMIVMGVIITLLILILRALG